MALPGRKPIPTETKRRAGNPGRYPLNDAEPVPEKGAPPVPEFLSDEAKQEWEYLCEQLDKAGILAQSDRAVMATYCDAWAQYIKEYRRVEEMGSLLISTKEVRDKGGNVLRTTRTPYINPSMAVKSMCWKHLLQCAAVLGLEPSTRSRIRRLPTKTNRGGIEKFFKLVS